MQNNLYNSAWWLLGDAGVGLQWRAPKTAMNAGPRDAAEDGPAQPCFARDLAPGCQPFAQKQRAGERQ